MSKLRKWSVMRRASYLKSVFSIVNFTFSSVSSVIFTLGWFAYGILPWNGLSRLTSTFLKHQKSNMAIYLTEQTCGNTCTIKRSGSGSQSFRKVLWLANSKEVKDLIGSFREDAGLKNFFPVASSYCRLRSGSVIRNLYYS